MALYTESDDWQKFAREQMRNSAQNLQQKQAGLDAAKNQKTQTSLVSALSGLVNGIKERGSDILNTVKNIEKTKYGWLDEIIANNDLKNAQKDDSARRNEIAKKYGFNSYSEAINSDRAGDNFWNEIKASNEQTKSRLKKNTDAYRNSITDVTKVNTNEAKGQALNTIDSVLGLIPGVGGVVANVAGGGISGVGDEYKAAGREGRDVDWSNAGKNALIGAASGVAGSLGGKAVGKVAGKMGGSTIGKLAGSNLAQGTIGGASAGAVGGALGTALNGGTLEDALLAAKEGAKAGAIGGGTMASVMGLGGTALDKIRNRGTVTPQTIEPADAQIVAKNKIQAPQTKAIEAEIVEPVKNRRGIAIKDYNAGIENIPVRVVDGAESVPGRGKYIDSVVRRSDANLPEAQRPIVEQAPIYYHGSPETNLTEFDLNKAGKNTMSGERAIYFTDSAPTAEEFAYERIPTDSIFINNKGKKGKVYQTNLDIKNTLDLDNLTDAQIAELWDYASPLGQLNGRDNFIKQMKYWRDEAKNPQLIKGNLDLGALAKSDYDSFSATMYPNSGNTAKEYGIFDPTKATILQNGDAGKTLQDALTKIDVINTPSIEDIIQVTRTQPQTVEPRYTESIIPARTYEQPTARANKVMNAEPTAVKPTPTATAVAEPEIDYGTQLARQKAQIAADKAKRQAIGGVIEQYGTTRLSDRIEGLPTAIEDMLDLGLTDRAEIELFSKKLASGDSEISKAIRTSLNEATPIDGKWGFTWEDVFNSAGAANNEAAQKQIKSFYDSQAKKILKADENGLFNRNDVYDFGKALEKEGYKKYDRGVRNQNTNTQVYGEALINMSQDIIGKATDGVDVSGKFNANKLKNLLPGNEAWANKVDTLNANAKTVQDLRSAMASATKMNLLKQAEEYNMNTYGQNVGGKGKGSATVKAAKAILTGKPLQAAEAGTELVLGSNKAKQKAIKKSYENYKKYQAQANGEAPTAPTGKLSGVKQTIADKTGKVGETAKNLAGKAAGIANNATASLNNDYLAGINGIRTRNGNPIEFNALGNQAQQFANKQMGKAEAERSQNRLENAQAVANAQNEYDNALADYNAQEANYNAQMAQSQGSNGAANMLGRIAAAMEMALNAGDITAYGQLADLYIQAAKIEELRNPAGTASGLNATQQKELNRMDTAANAIDELEKLYTNAGGGQGIVGGNIANLLGNVGINSDVASYNALSEGLINQIAAAVGKTDALNNEAEVKRALSLVPKITDTPQTAQTKLNTLREMLQTNRETMLTNYGA